MTARHRRFSLAEVTLGGVAVGGATVDLWVDGGGVERWAARLLMPASQEIGDGELVGTTKDGRRLQGPVRLGERHPGPRSGRVMLVELYGDGPLVTLPAVVDED